MILTLKFAYKFWHTVTLDQLKAKADAGYLTAEQFYEITGQEYQETAGK